MSKYLPAFAALLTAIVAALIAAPLLTTRAGVALLLALVTGALAASALFSRTRRRGSFPLVSSLAPADGENGSGDIATLGRLFEVTMSGMREGVLIVDRELRVVASNPAARAVFAHVSGGHEARYLTELTRNQSIREAFVDALGGEERVEVRVEQPGLERKVYDLRVMPLGAGGKRAGGAIGVFFDVTRLEQLEGVRQEFLSNVSHELRTPLSAILAFVETLEDGALNDPSDAARFLSIIRRNAERMSSLINDILELSAIEAGTVAVVPARVGLRRLAEDVFASARGKADARGVELRNEVAEGVNVYADERRLEQMLTNLVDNAIKFNREGGTVTLTHERAAGRDVIRVADTGEGIRAEHTARLFERFYRADKARSRELGGTGLGLAIVKHLALAHGGEVSVQSAFGEGSTFTIKLPVAPE